MLKKHNEMVEKEARLEFEDLLNSDSDFRLNYGINDTIEYAEVDFQEWFVECYQNKIDFLKLKLKEIKKLSEEITRSDLQGVIMTQAIKYNNDKREEIENIFLLYCDDELNINEAKRFLLELI